MLAPYRKEKQSSMRMRYTCEYGRTTKFADLVNQNIFRTVRSNYEPFSQLHFPRQYFQI
jgi:hypothetical protein